MILAFDTYYYENKAKTVCVSFENWTAPETLAVFSEILEDIEEYIPGEFYRRELPCILSLYEKLPAESVEAIIVDGFVYLDDEQKPGLGKYLYEQLEQKIPVIGVAKTNFATIERNKRPVFRGQSERPLYVTAVGIDLEDTAAKVKSMSGNYRIPDLLKQLDQLTKEIDVKANGI
ncbi:Endonuclease V [compost metagenome]